MRALCRQIPKVGAECLNWARSDLCGGRPAMDVPTANTGAGATLTLDGGHAEANDACLANRPQAVQPEVCTPFSTAPLFEHPSMHTDLICTDTVGRNYLLMKDATFDASRRAIRHRNVDDTSASTQVAMRLRYTR
jgi:hypothetical protein